MIHLKRLEWSVASFKRVKIIGKLVPYCSLYKAQNAFESRKSYEGIPDL